MAPKLTLVVFVLVFAGVLNNGINSTKPLADKVFAGSVIVRKVTAVEIPVYVVPVNPLNAVVVPVAGSPAVVGVNVLLYTVHIVVYVQVVQKPNTELAPVRLDVAGKTRYRPVPVLNGAGSPPLMSVISQLPVV